ncbi:MAG: type IV pilus assembly protein PilM [Patescibacteria group bacterium]
MSFFSTAETAFGLDISDQSLRLIQMAKAGRRLKIQSYNEIKLPAGCLIKGEINQPEVLAKNLEKLIKTKFGRGELSREAIIALPETETFLKTLEIEAEKYEEIPDKIKQLLPQSLPLDLDELYWDWQAAAPNGNNYQIVIGASPKKIIDDYFKIFTEAGLIPVVLEIEAAAITRLLVEHNHDETPQIIIDIGQSRTGLFLYDNGVKFTVSLPISGGQINEMISQSLDLSPEQAEAAKIACGLDEKKCEGAILELLTPIIGELSKQVLNAINFYYENYPSPNEIKKIVLGGGGANTINIANVLKRATAMETSISEPFKSLKNPNPKFFTPDKSQSFITAIGLGLRGLDPDNFYDHP